MNSPAVSLILPAHNAEATLRETLDTLLAQTLTDWELICVENGSSDATAALAEEYAAKDARVRVLHFGAIGAGAARNEGIAAARGRYLCFCDADDLFYPTMLEKLFRTAEAQEADIVLCAADEFADAPAAERHFHPMNGILPKRVTAHLPAETAFHPLAALGDTILQLTAGSPWGKLFRRSFVQQGAYAFSRHRYSEDIAFVYPALVAAERIAIVPKALLAYRNCADSRSHRKSDLYSEQLEAYRSLALRFQELRVPEPAMRSLRRRVACDLFWIIGNLSAKGKQGLREHYQRDYEPFFRLFAEEELPHTLEDRYLRELYHFFYPAIRFEVHALPPKEQIPAWAESMRTQLYPGYEIWCTAPTDDPETEQLLQHTAEEHLRFFRVSPSAEQAGTPSSVEIPPKAELRPRASWEAANGERRLGKLFRAIGSSSCRLLTAEAGALRWELFGKALCSVSYAAPKRLRYYLLGCCIHEERR